MTKITQKDLEGLCNRLNRMTNSPMEPYTKGEDGKFKANPGNYHLDYAYGGVKLVRMCNDGGGINTRVRLILMGCLVLFTLFLEMTHVFVPMVLHLIAVGEFHKDVQFRLPF